MKRIYQILIVSIILLCCIFIVLFVFKKDNKNTNVVQKDILNDITFSIKGIELRKITVNDLGDELLGLDYKVKFQASKKLLDNADIKLGFEIVFPEEHVRHVGTDKSGINYGFGVEDRDTNIYSTSFEEAGDSITEEDISNLFEARSNFIVNIYAADKIIKTINVPEEVVRIVE